MTNETFLERDWSNTNTHGPFSVTRRDIYHPTYGCAFRVPNLSLHLTEAQEGELPDLTPEWINAALDSMVRDEGGGRQEGVQPSVTFETFTISDEIIFDLLRQYETQIAFGEKTEAILENVDLPEPEDKIAAILIDPSIGNKKNAHEATKAEIKRGFDAACANGGPLVFLLPAFPFKDQNPFRSDLPPSVPDLGEVAMLIHLHCLAMAINQIYRHDVMWLIVSDGTVYEQIFDVEEGACSQYISALRDWRTRLNLGSSIHFIDLEDVVSRYDAHWSNNPARNLSAIKHRIIEFLRQAVAEPDGEQPLVASNLTELAIGQMWNRGWRELINQYDLDALWQVHVMSCNKEQLPANLHKAADEIWAGAMETAIQYAAFNLASKYTDLLSRFMPFAIRATSHPKPGQVGIPRETGVSPWNGVAIYDYRKGTKSRVRSTPLCQIPASTNIRFQLFNGAYPFGFSTREALECYI